MHTGCPVVEGIKWNAVKWIHGIPFREDEFLRGLANPHKVAPDPGSCEDLHNQCETWATAGECTKNADYVSVCTCLCTTVCVLLWLGLVYVPFSFPDAVCWTCIHSASLMQCAGLACAVCWAWDYVCSVLRLRTHVCVGSHTPALASVL